MKLFDFGAFQNFKQILSHDKIIFHMLFGAFQVTPRTSSKNSAKVDGLSISNMASKLTITKIKVILKVDGLLNGFRLL